MQKILLILIVLLLSKGAIAYDSQLLEQISNDMNKELPKPHDKYTTWETTFYSQGIMTYLYRSDFKISEFSSEDLTYFKSGYVDVLRNRVCTFYKSSTTDIRIKNVFQGLINRYITYDSQGKTLNNIQILIDDCYK